MSSPSALSVFGRLSSDAALFRDPLEENEPSRDMLLSPSLARNVALVLPRDSKEGRRASFLRWAEGTSC